MNKVFNINLGGLPITIDEDAYRYLENYLQSLHNHFKQSEGYEEIMNDIEARIGELLKENMGKRAIAMIQDVKNAVSVMGTPEDFGAESVAEGTTSKKSSNTEGEAFSSIKTGKRLFKDPENKVISGVCSGIASYFGIQDAIWVRLAFLSVLFFFGTGILLYIILSIILPEAKTTADRLAMQGEPIDVNTISKSVEKGVDSLAKKVNEFGNPENQERFTAGVNSFSSKLVHVIQTILMGMGGVWKFIIGAVVIGLIVAMLVSWVTGAIGLAMAYPIFGFITDSDIAPPIAIFCAFLLVSIPIVLMVLFLRRLFLHRPANGYVVGSLWAAWGISFFALGTLAGKTAKEFNQKAEYVSTTELANPNTDVMTISTLKNPYGDINTQLGSLRISEDFLLSYDVRVRIVKSPSDKFELTKNVYSRGRNQDEARRLMSSIDYKMENVGNELKFAHEFQLLKGTKWRDQSINITLKVPVGKKIKIVKDQPRGEFVDLDFTEADEWEDTEPCRDSEIAIWEMTENGMKCLNKKKKEDEE
jgi:phage shock protein PspC (stress-responsive transcriptional regulator)